MADQGAHQIRLFNKRIGVIKSKAQCSIRTGEKTSRGRASKARGYTSKVGKLLVGRNANPIQRLALLPPKMLLFGILYSVSE